MYLSGKDLRAMRQKAGYTTSEMAKIAGVKTRKTYENWEKDIGSPNVNQFIRICISCNLSSTSVINKLISRKKLEDEIELDDIIR